jgi:hypothetical protein
MMADPAQSVLTAAEAVAAVLAKPSVGKRLAQAVAHPVDHVSRRLHGVGARPRTKTFP